FSAGVIFLGWSGCSESKSEPRSVVANELIGMEGGTLSLAQTSTLEVPQGALTEPVDLGMRVVEQRSVPLLPSERTRVSDLVAVTPHGQEFSKPVTIRLALSRVPSGMARVYRLDNEADTTWEEVASLRVEGNEVIFETSRFSVYTAGSD